MAVSIAPLVRQCLGHLERLSCSEDTQFRDLVFDEWGRFRIWAGNISAHTTGRRSLEYRLRDSSELSSAVVRYLQELIKVFESADGFSTQQFRARPKENQDSGFDRDEDRTKRLWNAKTGEETQKLEGHDDDSMTVAFSSDNHDSEDDDSLFAEEDFGNAADGAQYSGLFAEVNEIITCLLRISMSLRNPARNDQIRYAKAVSVKHFEPRDIEHVRMKFPRAADSVVTRLGKAASRHRQYFKYREEHHQKLVEGILEDDNETLHDRTSTIATTLNQQSPATVVRSFSEDSDTESITTATSYAGTAFGDSELRPPPMPKAAEHGPFECPMCYYIITVADERSWRKHVYEDVPPYVCTNAGCKAISRQYSRRRDWCQHMKEHERYWLCPYGCTATHTSPEDFQHHLNNIHLNQSGNISTDALVDSCARLSTTVSARQCPLCFQEKPNFNIWQKHVGHHLEQLALFAIPQHLRGEECDDNNADNGDSDLVADEPEKGTDVNARGREYGNALQAASYRGYTEAVKLLLEKGADVNARGGQYGNALQAASSGGYEKIVRLLLDKGANIDAEGREVVRDKLKDDDSEPFNVGDRAQFKLSESQTPTWTVAEVRSPAKDGKTFYKLRMPGGKIYKDIKGDE